ncbi:hypothetical protein DZ860_11290 [Vibrio sinensis]|uniref:Uncharacterized protein n=1 Tax=Vibrio sinensis TaxID=2302434 RepID=A0A3A6QE52_9VIBR|nr:hypothetical protein [Vibrio sinensis]RJX70912.1 hypothetical protein DZ860_11290 [Vibrio sinensis]
MYIWETSVQLNNFERNAPRACKFLIELGFPKFDKCIPGDSVSTAVKFRLISNWYPALGHGQIIQPNSLVEK